MLSERNASAILTIELSRFHRLNPVSIPFDLVFPTWSFRQLLHIHQIIPFVFRWQADEREGDKLDWRVFISQATSFPRARRRKTKRTVGSCGVRCYKQATPTGFEGRRRGIDAIFTLPSARCRGLVFARAWEFRVLIL